MYLLFVSPSRTNNEIYRCHIVLTFCRTPIPTNKLFEIFLLVLTVFSCFKLIGFK